MDRLLDSTDIFAVKTVPCVKIATCELLSSFLRISEFLGINKSAFRKPFFGFG